MHPLICCTIQRFLCFGKRTLTNCWLAPFPGKCRLLGDCRCLKSIALVRLKYEKTPASTRGSGPKRVQVQSALIGRLTARAIRQANRLLTTKFPLLSTKLLSEITDEDVSVDLRLARTRRESASFRTRSCVRFGTRARACLETWSVCSSSGAVGMGRSAVLCHSGKSAMS